MSNASPIRCLVSAGPTREFLDPVRFLSNPSTGRMGFAVARAAVAAGWTVDLVSGPVSLPEPDGVVLYPVVTAAEMLEQVDALFDACDVLVMAAAVSDFRPREVSPVKVKKGEAAEVVAFERTVDILRHVTARKDRQFVVGFAAETHGVEDYARGKLESKNCDWIVANRVGGPHGGFADSDNTVLLVSREAEPETLGPDSKDAIARELVARIGLQLEGLSRGHRPSPGSDEASGGTEERG